MLDQILNLQIVTTSKMSLDEANHLIKQLECADLAKTAFIKGKLSLEDYFDILKLCGVNVDEYLSIIGANLQTVGIL